MADVLRPVELTAENAGDIPVIDSPGDRGSATRFPAGQAAEDGRLVRAAREGDEGAFSRLYDRYARVVHGLLMPAFGDRLSPDELRAVADFLAARKQHPGRGSN